MSKFDDFMSDLEAHLEADFLERTVGPHKPLSEEQIRALKPIELSASQKAEIARCSAQARADLQKYSYEEIPGKSRNSTRGSPEVASDESSTAQGE